MRLRIQYFSPRLRSEACHGEPCLVKHALNQTVLSGVFDGSEYILARFSLPASLMRKRGQVS